MSNIHTNDVFDAFVAAKAAIDKVPELEAQIAKLTTSLSDTETLLTLGDNERHRLRNDLDTITAAKSAAEVALDLQRKSNEDLQARFDLVVGTLRSLAGDIGSTISVVEPPKPEPQVEPVEVSVTVDSTPSDSGSVSSDQSATDPTPSQPVNASASGSGQLEPAGYWEAERRATGKDWFDTLGNRHYPEDAITEFRQTASVTSEPVDIVAGSEVTPTAPVPFAASTDAPSVPATSTEPTSSEAPVAEQSADVSPQSPWLKWGHNNTSTNDGR